MPNKIGLSKIYTEFQQLAKVNNLVSLVYCFIAFFTSGHLIATEGPELKTYFKSCHPTADIVHSSFKNCSFDVIQKKMYSLVYLLTFFYLLFVLTIEVTETGGLHCVYTSYSGF